jgi:hypothetical protein
VLLLVGSEGKEEILRWLENPAGDFPGLASVTDYVPRGLCDQPVLTMQLTIFVPNFIPGYADLTCPICSRSGSTMQSFRQSDSARAICHAEGRGFESHHPL